MGEVYKTREQSHAAYKDYVDIHIKCVKQAFNTYGEELCTLFCKSLNVDSDVTPKEVFDRALVVVSRHDTSKYSDQEFAAYAANFYPCEEDLNDPMVKENFDNAWKHHYKNNPHHPEFYIAYKINNYPIKMPIHCVVEMVCDWVGVSMTKNSSVYEWWINSGQAEKEQLLDNMIFRAVNECMEEYKDVFDFRKSV